ncbi:MULTISPECIES: PLP-dependent aminotransferase family protein [unclassified Novosphingobium]|uniref:MocR-like pyridoxine biosynthesis transcription factor PdxR n=1 Tax=unclassified Novosphingobium TaxID=2644732 RepID=UPI000D31E8DF|nr:MULTISPECIES: PLP-dependent aminotransferase family protein [unclassified Novosphingobium]PTR07628.1 GntR family transcriptional regulator [Novosphingobium sp. GV055]PUB00330.1 GntR family transcriptional regulator [Novosphingobium sp. GV061]PUB15371.1 GntR family transcriptional regulator [Novosphingobium sp. GV079]PUB39247.1 GntR family transcriptional regulator [Novosphingobium sp. GV027]
MRRGWSLTLQQRIRSDQATPLYMQLAHALIHEIERGRLQPGSALPSSRELAAELGFNRKTVVTAYEELMAQGWLEAAGRKGTAVAKRLPRSRPEAIEASPPIGRRPIYRFVSPPDRPIAVPPGRVIKLDEGSPDGSLFPPEALARAFRTAALYAARRQQLGYRDPCGSDKLRASLATMLREERGLVVDAENVCVTRGSQMGIALAARLLARPGAVALAEALTYEPAVAAFQAAGVPVLPVPLDDEGIDVDAVEHACRSRKVCAVFLTPHHQFPSTVSLAPERRLRLVELARQFGFAIIEDDYDHEFRFGSQPLLPMAAYAPDVVIYVGSLSKLLLPALRVGYIVAPTPVIAAAAHQVSIGDGMGNSLTEDAVAMLFEEGEVRRHARKATRIYGQRRDALAQAVQDELGDLVSARLPAGGLAMWLEFQDLAALARIEEGAGAAGITFAQSASYRLAENAPHGLRLGFASHAAERTVQAVRVLGALGRG